MVSKTLSVGMHIAKNVKQPVIVAVAVVLILLSNAYSIKLNRARIILSFISMIIGIALFAAGKISLYKEQTSKLVMNGAYQISRNPSYLGLVFCIASLTLYIWNIVAICVLIGFLLLFDKCYIPLEEEMLTDIYKETYLQYQAKVRRWL